MKDRKTYEKVTAAMKAGDRKAAKAASQKMNAKTTKQKQQFKAGKWW